MEVVLSCSAISAFSYSFMQLKFEIFLTSFLYASALFILSRMTTVHVIFLCRYFFMENSLFVSFSSWLNLQFPFAWSTWSGGNDKTISRSCARMKYCDCVECRFVSTSCEARGILGGGGKKVGLVLGRWKQGFVKLDLIWTQSFLLGNLKIEFEEMNRRFSWIEGCFCDVFIKVNILFCLTWKGPFVNNVEFDEIWEGQGRKAIHWI